MHPVGAPQYMYHVVLWFGYGTSCSSGGSVFLTTSTTHMTAGDASALAAVARAMGRGGSSSSSLHLWQVLRRRARSGGGDLDPWLIWWRDVVGTSRCGCRASTRSSTPPGGSRMAAAARPGSTSGLYGLVLGSTFFIILF